MINDKYYSSTPSTCTNISRALSLMWRAIDTVDAVNFSGASQMRIRQVAGDPDTLAACANVDEIVLNTVDDQIYSCTATGIATAATWTSTAGSGSQDFEGVYSTDAGNNLVTGDAIFTITTGTNDFVVDSADWNVTADTVQLIIMLLISWLPMLPIQAQFLRLTLMRKTRERSTLLN